MTKKTGAEAIDTRKLRRIMALQQKEREAEDQRRWDAQQQWARIRDEGVEAYAAGKLITDCPHERGENAKAWYAGFIRAAAPSPDREPRWIA